MNFMQEISSFFLAHSDLVWSIMESMLVPFQNSFLAGCAAAKATKQHKTRTFMFRVERKL